MLRNLFLLAGLGAALISGAILVGAATAAPARFQPAWVEQHVEEVSPGAVYRLEACLTLTEPGVEWLSVRVAWYGQSGGCGPTLSLRDQAADPWYLDGEQCLSLTDVAPCAALSARYGVIAMGDLAGVVISHLQFWLDAEATPAACPGPTATPTPTPAATATPVATTPPGASPAPTPTLTTVTPEPKVFAALVNGGFETLRADGTPYGWRKTGGEMAASATARAEGKRSLTLTSETTATKWAYQTVSVTGGRYYRATALTLNDDANTREALLRLSWYESADGGGSQMATSDSGPVGTGSHRFQPLDSGPVQAPAGAHSVKVRLMLRPASAGRAVAYFDAVRFAEVGAPPAAAGPLDSPLSDRGDDDMPAPSSAPPSSHHGAPALVVWAGRTPPANVKAGETSDAPVTNGGHDRPLWPFLLAFGIPALGLFAAGGHAWTRGRQARGNDL